MASVMRKQLDELTRHAAENSVSLWMPTHRAGSDIRQDPIRLKNLLGRAAEQLAELGVRPADARERLSPLREKTEDEGFWRQQAEGLGMLLGEGEPKMVRLPAPAPEIVTVCEHFHVKPLLAAMRKDKRFYILQLSEQTIRMLRAGRYDSEPVPLAGAPENFAEFMRFDDPERHVEFHSGTAEHQPAADRPAAFHGQGADAAETEKKKLADFCRRIDHAVSKALQDETAPLLLAATEPLQGIYRRVSACAQLDTRVIAGNPDIASDEDMHRQGVELLAEDLARPVRTAVQKYYQAKSAEAATSDLEEILRAAGVSAVDTLLVASDRQVWGRFNAETGAMAPHESQAPGDEDLLNLAAIRACGSGANVLAVPGEDVPDGAPAAAVLRFKPEG